MTGCSVSVPIESIVDDIIKNHKDKFVSAMSDAIAKELDAKFAEITDNHLVSFGIDKTNDQLQAVMSGKQVFNVSRAELQEWLAIQGSGNAGGIKSGQIVGGDTLRVTNADDTKVDIDVSSIRGGNAGGIKSGQIVGGDILRVINADDTKVDIDVSSIRGGNSPYITTANIVEANDKFTLEFTRSDTNIISVPLDDVVNRIETVVYDRVMSTGYTINTISDAYTLADSDLNGRTVIRADANKDVVVTITTPSDESFVGRSVVVRKVSGDIGTFTTLTPATGVTLVPNDSSILRRVGSAVTLVYIGNGVWDVFGELP